MVEMLAVVDSRSAVKTGLRMRTTVTEVETKVMGGCNDDGWGKRNDGKGD